MSDENWLIARLPGGEKNLRTRDIVAGRARAEAVFAALGREARWSEMTLTLTEPCARNLVAAIEHAEGNGPVEANTALAIRGNLPEGRYEGLLAASGHRHDAILGRAIEALGPPDGHGWIAERATCDRFSERDAEGVQWTWTRADADVDALWQLALPWSRDVLAPLVWPRVEVRGTLTCPLDGHVDSGRTPAHLSLTVELSLHGCRANVELALATDDTDSAELAATWDALCHGLGTLKPDAIRTAYRFGDGRFEIATAPTFWRGTGNKHKTFRAPKDPLGRPKLKRADYEALV